MINNSLQALKEELKKIAKEKDVDFNIVMRFYMYERFIERLSKSKYKDNLILKGGFFLSNLFGMESRSTMDIDAVIRNIKFNHEKTRVMIQEILNINIPDNVKFTIDKIQEIRDRDEYGGLRITINFKLENIKDKFHIDITTGDPIYPGPIDYSYESLIDNKVYKVLSYNLETVLAEKIETILSKLEANSRMKDYYDIYLIYKLGSDKISEFKLREAAKRTFKKREFKYDIIVNLNIIKDSSVLKRSWKSYARKNKYAKNILFEETIVYLEKFIEVLIAVKV